MKLSDYKDEEALDILADLIEPAAEIFSDKQIAMMLKNNIAPIKAVRLAIKKHKQAVIEIMAILEGVPVADFHCNIFTLPLQLLDILNDKDLMNFFSLQGQMTEEDSSGSATGNIEEKEQ